LTPILSSVDNGWLATGLRIVRARVPELARRAAAIERGMDFGFHYRTPEGGFPGRPVRPVIGLEEFGAAPRGGRRVTRLTGRKGDT
jgi:hypothetical protein